MRNGYGVKIHLVDGKSDWLISIMKDFDWLQVHINNGFKNSSVKATIKPVTDEQVFYDKFLCDKFYLPSARVYMQQVSL